MVTATGHFAKEKEATNVKKKKQLIVSLSLCGALLATVGVVLPAMPGGADQVRYINRYEYKDGKPLPDNGLCLFGDYEREFYLNYFYNGVFLNDESVTGNETPKEAARITAKNQMIEECKAYIESLYGKAMPEEVFDANCHYLTETLGEIAKLNREKTPEEKILLHINWFRGVISEDISYAEHSGHVSADDDSRNIPVMKEAVAKLKSLSEAFKNGTVDVQTTLEQYKEAVELLKVGCPKLYKVEKENEEPIESLVEPPEPKAERSPLEKLSDYTFRMLGDIDEEIRAGQNDSDDTPAGLIRNVPMLEEASKRTGALFAAFYPCSIDFESAWEEYKACVEMLKDASPSLYRLEKMRLTPLELLQE